MIVVSDYHKTVIVKLYSCLECGPEKGDLKCVLKIFKRVNEVPVVPELAEQLLCKVITDNQRVFREYLLGNKAVGEELVYGVVTNICTREDVLFVKLLLLLLRTCPSFVEAVRRMEKPLLLVDY